MTNKELIEILKEEDPEGEVDITERIGVHEFKPVIHSSWKLIKRKGGFTDIVCDRCGGVRFKDYAYNCTIEEVLEHIRTKEKRKLPAFCEECGAMMDKEIDPYNLSVDISGVEDPHWNDCTDYCPSAYGFGDDPTEPIWNWECSACGNHIFDEENPPQECPYCKSKMNFSKTER